jgi:hypothetical protein
MLHSVVLDPAYPPRDTATIGDAVLSLPAP